MSPLLRMLGRGALAGGMSGLLSAAVGFVVGEPSINAAVALEEAAADHGSVADHGHEVFSRATQQFGLLVAAVVTGVAVGLIFALVYAIRHRDDPDAQPWQRANWLAAAGFVGVSLIPFLRYPANPPAVGDAATVDLRTRAYLGAILIGLAAVTAAWQLHMRLLERGVATPLRQLAVGGLVLVGLAATFLLPANTDPIDAPARLIWDFRLASVATIASLWFGLGTIFGLLSERATRTSASAAQRAAV